jgi:cell division protein FtsZ
MSLNLKMPEQSELRPRITVFGVGGAGGNAVNNMIDKALEGAEFVVANTDAQALQQSRAMRKLQLGVNVTQGLGAGAKPAVGASAAEESLEEVIEHLAGSHMCFITAGMGGGTGTGAAPVIARAARDLGILTVGVVTKPFQFEGAKRMSLAEAGVEELQRVVDTLIIIPNQNLFRLANERTTFAEAFMMADDVLYQGVKGVTDLMVRPGIINLDFADVRSVMDEMGKAMMGTGEAEGENRAVEAAEKAIANPLLDEISLKGAKGVLINITGGYDLTLFELDEAANRIRSEVDPDANIIVGSTLDPDIEGIMCVSVVATGIEADAVEREIAVPRANAERPAPLTLAASRPEEEEVEDEIATLAARAADEAHAMAEMSAAQTHMRETGYEDPSLFDLDDEQPPVAPVEAPAAQSQFEQGGAFIAPQAAKPGEPTPETLRILEAAVKREPKASPEKHFARPIPKLDGEAPAGERGRFGINSLIHRMTGAGSQNPPRHGAGEPSLGGQSDRAHGGDDLSETDRQRDIPAFLRRQAN